jgi:hypothetical protein
MEDNPNLTDHKPVLFYPGREIRDRLDRASNESGMGLSEICRRAVVEYLDRRTPQPDAAAAEVQTP